MQSIHVGFRLYSPEWESVVSLFVTMETSQPIPDGCQISPAASAIHSAGRSSSRWEPSHAGPAPAALGPALPQRLLPGPAALLLGPHPAAGPARLGRPDALLVLSPGDGGSGLCQLCRKKPNLPPEKK